MSKTTTHYISVLIRQARQMGLDVDRILSETGVPVELSGIEDGWIDIGLYTALVKRMWQESNDETLGFDPTPMRIGTWALVCEFMLSAETLGDLYRKCEHILSYLPSKTLALSMVPDSEMVSITHNTYTGVNDPSHFLVEFMTVVWHRFPSWAIDENIQLQQAFFSHSKPPHGNFYDELFHCEIVFDQPKNGFCFDRKYLSRRIVRSKQELNHWLRNSPADLMYLPGRETSIQSHIKVQLVGELKKNKRFPAFTIICGNLAMSSQVVRRRLAEEGTSYQKLKNLVRRDLALELLSSPEILITEIADRTGFNESAAFSNAFKKWTGISPSQYRTGKSPEI